MRTSNIVRWMSTILLHEHNTHTQSKCSLLGCERGWLSEDGCINEYPPCPLNLLLHALPKHHHPYAFSPAFDSFRTLHSVVHCPNSFYSAVSVLLYLSACHENCGKNHIDTKKSVVVYAIVNICVCWIAVIVVSIDYRWAGHVSEMWDSITL